MKKVLTGLQPTGVITLGNYIGAIKQMVKYQEEYDSYIFVADMHSITIPQDPEGLRKNIRSLIALYLACGIDEKKNKIFLQSENEYHSNVSWLLECTTYYGELSRMTQFKDKKSKNENFTAITIGTIGNETISFLGEKSDKIQSLQSYSFNK